MAEGSSQRTSEGGSAATLVAVDGRRQRNALTAAEQAIVALAAGDTARASDSAASAASLDQIGVYAGLPDAVAVAVGHVEQQGSLGEREWAQLRTALPPGPLQALVDAQHL